ncbi:MAG: glycosyltransferase family 2 protein [Planctomycetaceae bacterium]|nr:glycosyltransferase family 2 protein [Planctomycetaceae bacterium]
MHDLRLSLVIPAYNEEKNLPHTVAELQSALRGEGIPYEILIVNDNSRDGTERVVRELMADDPDVRLVTRRPPGGFGRAVRSGLDEVTGDVVMIVMADCSDHPSDVVAYYRKICEGYDCVFGSRFIKGSKVTDYPLKKLVVNRIVNKLMQWAFWCKFNDLTNAFKAYRTDVVRELGQLQSSHFNITIEMSLGAIIRKYNIAQIPISWTGRTWGSSNLRLREMGRRYLATLIRIFGERMLLSDDLLAERLAARANGMRRRTDVDAELCKLANRVETLERQRAAEEAAARSCT